MSEMMLRREFVAGLGSAAAALPLAARAQQPGMPVIGLLYGVSAAEWTQQIAGFRRGLSEAGFVEGRNVSIEYRWADGQFERLPAMAADLVSRKVAVIQAGGSTIGVRAAMAASRNIPIVFTTTSDPVAVGLVASLNRPGGNVTGVTSIGRELEPKRLELLHEAIPTASKIALLVTNSPERQQHIESVQAAARYLGLEAIVLYADSETEIDRAFEAAVQQRAGAVSFGAASYAYLNNRRDQVAALGLRHALPVISNSREAVVAGMLMSYGPNTPESYRQAGIYVGRILKGEKPADLPVQQPTRFELVVNIKTAKAIGLTIPETFLVRADEVIE